MKREFDRVPLICLPTPLHRLDRLSKEIGAEVWVKRDDLTGFALGGNKGRKLEYLIAEALRQRAEAVVSCGALQSNFVRQLGAACAVVGLECHAAVMECPFEDAPPIGRVVGGNGGNARLDRLFGVHLHLSPNSDWETLYANAEAIAAGLERSGKRVFRFPVGGSTPLGAFSFLRAAEEALEQQPEGFDWVVTASSSGSTHVGLQAGFGSRARVVGIAADPEPEIVNDFAALSMRLSELTDADFTCQPIDYDLRLDWVGPGYSVHDDRADAVIERLARTEGLLLDPVYSGKAMAGLIDLVAKGELTGRILFWHTGGVPTLFAD